MVLNPELHPDWEGWPTNEEAARLLCITVRHLNRLVDGTDVEKPKLIRYHCPDDSYRYNPGQVMALRQERAAEHSELVSEVLGVQPMKQMTTDNPVATLMLQHAVSVKWANQHTEEIFRLSQQPIKVALDNLQKDNESLRKANAQLTDKLTSLLEVVQKVALLEHQREIELTHAQASEARTDELVSMLKDIAAPLLMHHLMKDKPVQGTAAAKAQATTAGLSEEQFKTRAIAAYKLCNSLDDTRVNALLDPKGVLLDAEQRGYLAEALGREPGNAANGQSTQGDSHESTQRQ